VYLLPDYRALLTEFQVFFLKECRALLTKYGALLTDYRALWTGDMGLPVGKKNQQKTGTFQL